MDLDLRIAQLEFVLGPQDVRASSSQRWTVRQGQHHQSGGRWEPLSRLSSPIELCNAAVSKRGPI